MFETFAGRGMGILIVVAVSAGLGQPGPCQEPSSRPAAKEPATDCWDSIKHVSLGGEDMWMSLGGSLRYRGENWKGFGFGSSTPEDHDLFGLGRALIHADMHFTDTLRVYVEGKSATTTGRELAGTNRTSDVDSADLEQAYVDLNLELGDGKLTIRPGRMALSFGKERLVSPLDWSNTLRRWDGGSIAYEHGSWTTTGFWAEYVPVRKYRGNRADADNILYGVYATGKLPGEYGCGMDLYLLGRARDGKLITAQTYNGSIGGEERFTAGARFFGKCGKSGIDYDLEGAYQFGRLGQSDIRAYMGACQFGYTPEVTKWAPRYFIGLDYASGDDNPGGDVQTFDQLFPLGHAYLGYIDTVGRQNIIDLSLGTGFKCSPKVQTDVAVHIFWREDESDAFYDAAAAQVRAGNAGTRDQLGSELDLTVKYDFGKHTKGLFGYSRFFAEGFIDESGPGKDIEFVYAQLLYTF